MIDLTEIIAIGNSYAIITEMNFALAKFEKAENTGMYLGGAFLNFYYFLLIKYLKGFRS